MSAPVAFHLRATKADLNNAKLAIVPGDPERVKKLASKLDNPVHLGTHREFCLYVGELQGKPIVLCSTGIGGPSTSIAVEELAQMGITTFLRVGTTGAIQPNLSIGDIIVTTASVRLDGASRHFAPLEFPAVADFECTTALVAATKSLGLVCHVGVSASSDTFYPGQERYDTYSGRVVSSLRNSLQQWREMGVLNYEMESATLFTMCSSQGLQAGMIAGVIVNRTLNETPLPEEAAKTEDRAVNAVIEAARRLL